MWLYIHVEQIPIVPLYYAAEREVVERNGSIVLVYPNDTAVTGREDKPLEVPHAVAGMRTVHWSNSLRSCYVFRRLSRKCCRFAGRSARTAPSITTKKASMEMKKREGYF